MKGWQDRENGEAVLDGWYAILISWGTQREEDSPDVLQFKDGAWVLGAGRLCLPDFEQFQGPFQSYRQAYDWAHANDPVGRFFAERTEATP